MGALSTLPPSVWLDARAWPDGFEGSMMDRLYNRLDGLYPTRWRSAFADKNAIANWREAWAEAFAEERLSPEEVKRGLAECRRKFDWPPSLPEFLKACRPPIDYEAAFCEAVAQYRLREEGRDVWSAPAIYWAATKIGLFDLRNATYSGIKGRWAAAMNEALEAIRTGKLPAEVPQAAKALPAPGETSVDPEETRRRIAAMAAALAKTKAFPQ